MSAGDKKGDVNHVNDKNYNKINELIKFYGGGDGSDAQLSPVSEAASARLSETLREFDAL